MLARSERVHEFSASAIGQLRAKMPAAGASPRSDDIAMTRRTLLHWRPDRWDWRDKHCIVWVSIAKLDASWRKAPAFWLPPGSGSRFGGWLAKQSPNCRIIMPVIGWVPEVVRDQRGRAIGETGAYHVLFENGRHRTAWMRDHGATALPVLADFEQAEVIEAELGTVERCTLVRVKLGETPRSMD